jgi:hypothetical protein
MTTDNLICDLSEWKNRTGRITNKCSKCGKHYRLPSFIFEPRDKICFTCETLETIEKVTNEAVKNYRLHKRF